VLLFTLASVTLAWFVYTLVWLSYRFLCALKQENAKMLFSPLQNKTYFVANHVFSIYVLRGAVIRRHTHHSLQNFGQRSHWMPTGASLFCSYV